MFIFQVYLANFTSNQKAIDCPGPSTRVGTESLPQPDSSTKSSKVKILSSYSLKDMDKIQLMGSFSATRDDACQESDENQLNDESDDFHKTTEVKMSFSNLQ